MKNKELISKSYELALKIVKVYRKINKDNEDCFLARQLLRRGTSIGENIVSTQHCVSQKSFYLRMSEALKEAKKTQYWLSLLIESNFLSKEEAKEIEQLLNELIKNLMKIVKNAK